MEVRALSVQKRLDTKMLRKYFFSFFMIKTTQASLTMKELKDVLYYIKYCYCILYFHFG